MQDRRNCKNEDPVRMNCYLSVISFKLKQSKVTGNFCLDLTYEPYEIRAGCWIRGFSDSPEVSRDSTLAASGKDGEGVP